MTDHSASVARKSIPPSAGGMQLQRKCACGTHAPGGGICTECRRKADTRTHAHLEIVDADDTHEREADQVADHVVSTPRALTTQAPLPRFGRFPGHQPMDIDGDEASVGRALTDPGRPLEPALRQDMEQRFGHNFSRLRMYSGAGAAESARNMDAKAYALGEHIVFGAGHFAPYTPQGRHLLAHELSHVVQQQAGSAGIQREPAADSRWSNDVQAARYRGQLMAKRIRIHTKLSKEARAKINHELAYFEGEAKEAYIHEVKPVLASVVEIEMPAESVSQKAEKDTPEISCESGQAVLAYQGQPGKDRCLPDEDPEFRQSYIDNDIVLATGLAIPGTTWENITDERIPIMRLTYRNGRKVDINVSDVPLSGGAPAINSRTVGVIRPLARYEKHLDGFIYPIRGSGKSSYVSYGDANNIMSLRAGLHDSIKELQKGFTLIQITAGFASDIAALGNIAAMNHAFNSGGLFEPVVSRKGGAGGIGEETGISSGKGNNTNDIEQGGAKPSGEVSESDTTGLTQGEIRDEGVSGKKGAPAQQKPTNQREQDEQAGVAKQKLANENDKKTEPDQAEDENEHAGGSSDPDDSAAEDFEDLEPEGAAKPKKRKSRDPEDSEKDEPISDSYSKKELENSGWLRRRLPNASDRRLFMEYLQEGHAGAGHSHLNPGSRQADSILNNWASGQRGLDIRP